MINIVLWVFFGTFVFPFNYCSGDEAVPVYLNVKNATTTTNASTIECDVTQKDIKIQKGDVINLNVTSQLMIHFKSCIFYDTYGETTIMQLTNPNIKQNNGFHKYNFELYVRQSGNWLCKFFIHKDVRVVQPVEVIENTIYTVAKCNMTISIYEPLIQSVKSMLLGVGIGLSWLIIPIIVSIMYCIKRRASPVHDLKSLSVMQRPKQDRDAANTMNNADDIPATASNTNGLKETDKTAKPKEKYKLKNVGKMFWLPAKFRKTVQDEDTHDGGVRIASDENTKASRKQAKEKEKRTSLERIKERPPLPLPLPPSEISDEEYEDMSAVPHARTPEPAKTKPPIPSPKAPEANKHELNNKLKKKLPVPPTKPVEKLPKPIPPPQTQKKSLKSPFITNPETVNELENVLKKKGIGPSANTTASTRFKGLLHTPSLPIQPATQKPAPPSAAAKPPLQTTLQKPCGPKIQPPPSITRKPTLPSPMDAPVPPPISTLPRPTQSLPVKEPEEDDCEWDGEDWTYEPLPQQNIYSM
ncbi:pollen-specific leucine-rich repeat extensin-like protein 1 isoform X2 [Manduca sexta]|uniref:pollen-specific leucine-rich repeat extensin-like protein 1 isoform X2 n=1 Tax=Manduca sexta TaxID=7130 RepID=UPI0018902BA2|nr:pollen-specific leucine-rich repeat extensin-like protein 1 isoform X2 [Manduca sexta]